MRTFAQKPKTTQPATSATASTVSRAHPGQGHAPNSILDLQRTIGNHAVQRLLQSKRVWPGQVVETEPVQARDVHIAALPAVDHAPESPGQPLDPGTRAFMEPRFGHD